MIPDWIEREIQKAQWISGKLNCMHCGARLGGFNFVSSIVCSCGLSVTVHLCKSRTDRDPALPVRVRNPSLDRFCHYQATSIRNKKNLGHGSENILTSEEKLQSSSMESCTPAYNSGLRKLTDVLCLEVRPDTVFLKNDRDKIHCKTCSPHLLPSVSSPANSCAVKQFHKMSHSLDYNIRGSPSILPVFSRTCSPTCMGVLQTEMQAYSQVISVPLPNTISSTARQDYCFTNHPEILPGSSASSSNICTEIDHGYHNSPVPVSGRLPHHATTQSPTVVMQSPSSNSTEDEEGEGYGVSENLFLPSNVLPQTTTGKRLRKREKNKLKSLRRKQRRRERWLQSQQTTDQASTDDDDGEEYTADKDGCVCAVCLDVYFSPYMCYPCHHIFCEPCLRTLAKDSPTNTPCPLCRTVISRVYYQAELNNTTKNNFPKAYSSRKQYFQKSSCSKWPLPSCRRLFRVFGGFSRHMNFLRRRQFPHGAYRLENMDFEDENHGWRFDMDMVIIYIYSVNWIIGFIIFCFLCYIFFPFT
ncbi:E3 ubiquitin-protein ligase RNF180 [Protopterus annectens]|uniref:E3 ubiquitin-protein ligase RNF180 n=1 Tax=Protopterus annectens TaxID=7888 RepID=UPI001CF9950C|nr:E3 ubiquitin-protein ligase RNF180 [Protopterus annectens]